MMIRKICLSLAALLCAAGSLPARGTAAPLPADKCKVAKVRPYAPTNRPKPEERSFASAAVDAEIERIKGLLTNAKLRWMFENCFPNTLDTTVRHRKDADGSSSASDSTPMPTPFSIPMIPLPTTIG